MQQVLKRDTRLQQCDIGKIVKRIQRFQGDHIDALDLARKVVHSLNDCVPTRDIDLHLADCAAHILDHSQYRKLAAYIFTTMLAKEACNTFIQSIQALAHIIHPHVYQFSVHHAHQLEDMIDYERDHLFDYFGLRTLKKSYLYQVEGKTVEKPQHLFMRVAVGIHCFDHDDGGCLESIRETYDYLSRLMMTHATPTLFNAGTHTNQLASCFLIDVAEDSIEGIFKTITDCARISKVAGGIGISVHKIRAKNSIIKGTLGTSSGLVPMLRVFNATARYVDQAGKRKGSFAIYLEPWHADILDVLDLKKNTGPDELRTRDLFYALWIPDLFMTRVQEDASWSLFCPSQCPKLLTTYGTEFEQAYKEVEEQGLAISHIRARDLFEKIITTQIESGNPYLLYKDACNRKSNQRHLGLIKSSNLCSEIIQYTDDQEIAVCNLASICLPQFITHESTIDHEQLFKVTQCLVKNLNKIIAINRYPVPESHVSNQRHRPIGIGIQGLANVFALLKIAYTSEEAKQINKEVAETIYYAALDMSCQLVSTYGSYHHFDQSPLGQGQFQFNLWDFNDEASLRWDWALLRDKIQKQGLVNSLVTAYMPTASTAQIMGNNDSFEPFTSNIYTRRVLSGEFIIVNPHLIDYLEKDHLWTEALKEDLIRNNGSVQQLPLPEWYKEVFKTVWEISMKDYIDMSADRALFIDQSQSLNLYMEKPSLGKISSMHMYAWKKGLKTGIYYLRSKSATQPIKITCSSCTS